MAVEERGQTDVLLTAAMSGERCVLRLTVVGVERAVSRVQWRLRAWHDGRWEQSNGATLPTGDVDSGDG